MLSLIVDLLIRWVSLCATTSKCKATLLAWSDFSYNWMVYWLSYIVIVATSGATLDDFWAVRAPLIPGLFFFAVVYGCISVALQAMAKADRLVLCKRRVLPPAGL